MTFQTKANSRNRNKSVVARRWVWVKRLTTKWHKGNFCGDGNILYFTHAQLCVYVFQLFKVYTLKGYIIFYIKNTSINLPLRKSRAGTVSRGIDETRLAMG